MASSEDQPLTMDRSSRLTRGKRMTKLLDEEIEEDELFWNQDALQEEANDDNYEEEHEVPDEFDSDFEDDEPEQDDEVEVPVEDRMRDKKKLIFPGKQDSKKKNKKAFSKLKEISKAEKSPQEMVVAHTENQDATDAFDGERAVRKSTRTSVIVRQAERDAIRAALQATIKPSKRKKEGEEKRMTQEEMLLEAAQTEIMNLRNLERVLAREEEVKKKAVVHKAVYEGPQVRFMSKNGISSLEYMKGSSFKSELCTASAPYPQKSFCVVTGLPARYRDPNTGLPYATVEAFKIIRERLFNEEAGKRKRVQMDMGELLDSLSCQGFLCKRRRSGADKATTKPSDSRFGARFRRIPALETPLDLD